MPRDDKNLAELSDCGLGSKLFVIRSYVRKAGILLSRLAWRVIIGALASQSGELMGGQGAGSLRRRVGEFSIGWILGALGVGP